MRRKIRRGRWKSGCGRGCGASRLIWIQSDASRNSSQTSRCGLLEKYILPAQDLRSKNPVSRPTDDLPHSPSRLLQLLRRPKLLIIKLEDLERRGGSHIHSRRRSSDLAPPPVREGRTRTGLSMLFIRSSSREGWEGEGGLACRLSARTHSERTKEITSKSEGSLVRREGGENGRNVQRAVRLP